MTTYTKIPPLPQLTDAEFAEMLNRNPAWAAFANHLEWHHGGSSPGIGRRYIAMQVQNMRSPKRGRTDNRSQIK